MKFQCVSSVDNERAEFGIAPVLTKFQHFHVYFSFKIEWRGSIIVIVKNKMTGWSKSRSQVSNFSENIQESTRYVRSTGTNVKFHCVATCSPLGGNIEKTTRQPGFKRNLELVCHIPYKEFPRRSRLFSNLVTSLLLSTRLLTMGHVMGLDFRAAARHKVCKMVPSVEKENVHNI